MPYNHTIWTLSIFCYTKIHRLWPGSKPETLGVQGWRQTGFATQPAIYEIIKIIELNELGKDINRKIGGTSNEVESRTRPWAHAKKTSLPLCKSRLHSSSLVLVDRKYMLSNAHPNKGEKDYNDNHRDGITDFVQSLPGFQECDEDVETWMAIDAEALVDFKC
ncbi:hypothetical protein TNCV_3232801 [Trichonephila clavipes]|nr:hypothetical protein TNCV_3232801 [Trichonephila clavipes]